MSWYGGAAVGQRIYLETERLQLRAIDSTDAENLYELNKDPEVMRYLGKEFNTLEGAREALNAVVARNERYNNQLGLFAAFIRDSGEYIGWFILRPEKEKPDDLQNLEIGYRLKKSAWGNGYGTEGSKALLEKARKDFNVRRVYATAMRDNRASRHIMEKIGLKFVKYFTNPHYQGQPDGDVLYEITF